MLTINYHTPLFLSEIGMLNYSAKEVQQSCQAKLQLECKLQFFLQFWQEPVRAAILHCREQAHYCGHAVMSLLLMYVLPSPAFLGVVLISNNEFCALLLKGGFNLDPPSVQQRSEYLTALESY